MKTDTKIYELKEHELGFLQVHPLPSAELLESYYREKYYQSPTVATYAAQYSAEELNLQKIACEVADSVCRPQISSELSLYDIGCGEGHFLNGMSELGWQVSGTDYSDYGIKSQNPHLLSKTSFGPALEEIDQKIKDGSKYSLINLGNVLEHVLDPIFLLKEIRKLMPENGLLRIVVPNDNSELQNLLFEEGLSNREWFYPPDHLSYFNFKTLHNTLVSTGFETIKMLGDFPIEMQLFNHFSNYYQKPETGREAHKTRVKVINFIRESGLEKYINWSSAMAEVKLSRSCIFFCRKKTEK